jgi:adenine-specific DNA methylase
VSGSRADGTIWYMGVKTRLLDRLEQTLTPLLHRAAERRGGAPVLLDLFAGTGVVGARLAPHARVVATDVQAYASTLAGARLRPAPGLTAALDRVVARAAVAREELCARYGELLDAEQRWLTGPRDAATLQAYRGWAEAEARTHEPELEGALRDGAGFPPCLLTAYYRNVYFGVRQAIELDALRWAVEAEEEPDTRRALLAALLYSASRSTSATAHFAQPRALGRISEVRALLARRSIDVAGLFRERVGEIAHRQAGRAAGGALAHAHEARRVACHALMDGWGTARLDVVYADPPYTADHYSRFYHVLETLVRYDYPWLARRGGELLKGRYPVAGRRHQSPFSHASTVADAFRSVCRFAASRGAALVWSYARTNGLLVREVLGGDMGRFRALLGEHYGRVHVDEVPLFHSGAGSRNHAASELIVTCTEPRG